MPFSNKKECLGQTLGQGQCNGPWYRLRTGKAWCKIQTTLMDLPKQNTQDLKTLSLCSQLKVKKLVIRKDDPSLSVMPIRKDVKVVGVVRPIKFVPA